MSLLNERLRLKLTKHDINYMYNCQILSKSDSSKSDWYLNAQNGPIRLISYLPNLNKPTEGGYLVISGNWNPDGFSCPTSIKAPGS